MQPMNEGGDLSGKATSRIVITLNMSKLLEYMNHTRTNERKKAETRHVRCKIFIYLEREDTGCHDIYEF